MPRSSMSRSKAAKFTIGVISDTHGLLRPEALKALRGSNLILHAGDIGAPEIIAELREIAPVVAVRGNIDRRELGPWTMDFPVTNVAEAEGHSFYLLHNVNELDLNPKAAGFAAVISGHSHKPAFHLDKNVLYFNPGSAGPRRFALPISVGRIRVHGGMLEPEIVELS